MELVLVHRNGVPVLVVHGPVMSGQAALPLHEQVRKLKEGGITEIVVDLSQVQWFGSAMLGMLVACLMTVRRVGGDLRLAGLSKKCQHVLEVAHLDRVFLIYETVDQAVMNFRGGVIALSRCAGFVSKGNGTENEAAQREFV